MKTQKPIDRRCMLKGSVLGGAVLAESLFGLLPESVRASPQNSAAAAPQSGPKSLDVVPPIKLEYVFQIRIDFSERVSFATPNGRRAYVPAVSGVIEGPRLQGKVVPHSGADYAGNGRLDAHYMLQASDGTMIYINNTGYLYPIDGKPIDRNDPSWGGDREFYFRCTPYFDTPVGPHDWLTRTVIVGTGKRHANPDYTIFTYYAVL
ncbi:MAG TPA: DUF3237 domain-containing protein [Candidatus Acidoferrales bacterium]|nr:DUF3237 domain-containing protein [Candidatus Acidoferrales bacterium]